jgi:hypothetical protein
MRYAGKAPVWYDTAVQSYMHSNAAFSVQACIWRSAITVTSPPMFISGTLLNPYKQK